MKNKIIILVLIWIVLSVLLIAESSVESLQAATLNGKGIVTGMWKGDVVEYVEGEILFKAKMEAKSSDLERLFKSYRT